MNDETKETTEIQEEEVVEENEEVAELPDNVQPYEMVEVIDDLIASGQGSDFAKNEYYYSFKQGNKVIQGLTASAYAHISLLEGVSIEDMKVKGLKTGYEADAIAIKLDTGQRAYGTGFAPYKDHREQLDVFAKQKAMTRAARNARKQLLPFESIVTAIEGLSALPNTLPPASKQQQLPPSQQTAEDEKTTKSKQMFAVWNEHETNLLNDYQINKFTFWAGVKVKCAIVTRAAMTIKQMDMIINALQADEYPQWIKDLQHPNVRVKLYAICEERKKDLPNDIWEQLSQKTGVKTPNRFTVAQADMCYKFICEQLGIKVEEEDVEDVTGEATMTENQQTETTPADEDDTNIPF